MTVDSSYGQILRTSTIMGGVAGIGFFLAMVRIKFAAVTLGADGIGLLTSFVAVQTLIATFIGLGLQSSATRAIADAFARQDMQSISRIIRVLHGLSWLSGLACLALTLAFSSQVSIFTFGNSEHQGEIASLGFVVFLLNLGTVHTALIQGARRIGDMARANTLGSAAGTAIAIGCYVVWGMRGILPSLVFMAGIQLLINWYYSRRIMLPLATMNWSIALTKSRELLSFGATFMWNGLLVSGVNYITLTIVTKSVGLAIAGIYSAAIAISNASVAFILGAMAADYFPQLSAARHDRSTATRIVNEQAEIGLLLALPCLLAILTFAPWILRILYASEFEAAVTLIQLLVLGCLGRVIAWPIGMVMPALGKARWFFYCETFANLLHVGLIIVLLPVFGLEGIGLASVILYAGYITIVYFAAVNFIDFVWFPSYRHVVSRSLVLIICAFVIARWLPILPATLIGSLVTALGLIFSMSGLLARLGHEHRAFQTFSKIPGLKVLLNIK